MNSAIGPLQAVLFICSLNSVRSPMAEALARMRFGKQVYFDSAGLRKSERDAFALAALREVGIEFEHDEAQTLDDVECESFDLVIALSQEAYAQAQELLRATSVELRYWDIEDVTQVTGSREQRMHAYRGARDAIDKLIRQELGERLKK